MTPSPPQFFRQLAPWIGQREGAVHAALPPRFAPRLNHGELEVGTSHEGSEAARRDEGVPARPLPDRPKPDEVSAPASSALGGERFADASRVAVATPEAPAQREVHAAAAASVSPRAAPRVVEEGSRRPIDAAMRSERAAPIERTFARPEPRLEGAAGAVSRSAPTSDAIAVRLPLRIQTVSGHVPSPRREGPTIVEVTIDRIDVRVPPASSPAPRAAPPRVAPTQSLADYLRQRDREAR